VRGGKFKATDDEAVQGFLFYTDSAAR
jgi:hypothetical protein